MVRIEILPILFIVLALMVIFGFILYSKFLFVLRENHSETWKQLGSPTVITNSSLKNNFLVWNFLKNKDYVKCNDPQLTKISQFIWNYVVAYLLFFILTLFIFLVIG